jgi:hypothetical protein
LLGDDVVVAVKVPGDCDEEEEGFFDVVVSLKKRSLPPDSLALTFSHINQSHLSTILSIRHFDRPCGNRES